MLAPDGSPRRDRHIADVPGKEPSYVRAPSYAPRGVPRDARCARRRLARSGGDDGADHPHRQPDRGRAGERLRRDGLRHMERHAAAHAHDDGPGQRRNRCRRTDSEGRFLGGIGYGPQYLPFTIEADTGPQDPFGVTCSTKNQFWTCSVQNATTTTPWVVNLRAKSSDRTPPALRVRAPASLAQESLREAGLPVVLRSNEPGRARIELIARRGARHAAVARTLRWAGRDYPVTLRLNAAGRRAVQVFDVYTLRIRVSDHAGNRRIVQRRIVIR
jgi:hypothetical protein